MGRLEKISFIFIPTFGEDGSPPASSSSVWRTYLARILFPQYQPFTIIYLDILHLEFSTASRIESLFGIFRKTFFAFFCLTLNKQIEPFPEMKRVREETSPANMRWKGDLISLHL